MNPPLKPQLIVLAAGYATRLYPLTRTQPKPLLPVGGRPMLERVLERVAPAGPFERAFVVSNDRFARAFESWAAGYSLPQGLGALEIVNDGSTSETDRRGAIGDLDYVIRTCKLKSDLVVVAGDNLFTEDLAEFGRFCRSKQAPVLGVYDLGSLAEMEKYSSITLGPDGRIAGFVEKPKTAATSLAGIALYYYPAAVVPRIRQYLDEGNNPDQPGRLVQWMYPQTPFFTWQVPGQWFDIGSLASLEEASALFNQGKS